MQAHAWPPVVLPDTPLIGDLNHLWLNPAQGRPEGSKSYTPLSYRGINEALNPSGRWRSTIRAVRMKQVKILIQGTGGILVCHIFVRSIVLI